MYNRIELPKRTDHCKLCNATLQCNQQDYWDARDNRFVWLCSNKHYRYVLTNSIHAHELFKSDNRLVTIRIDVWASANGRVAQRASTEVSYRLNGNFVNKYTNGVVPLKEIKRILKQKSNALSLFE